MEGRAPYASLGPCLLGLDIGGSKTGLIYGTVYGQVLRRSQFATPAFLSFDEAFVVIADQIEAFRQTCHAAGLPPPAAISVAVGGPLDILAGILFAPPHLAAWGEAPLKPRLEQRFGLPVFVEHDGNAGALAEFYFGAGRGARNMIFLTLGTGLGAGIIIDGAIFHGSTDTAGEVGHMRVAEDGPVEYGKAGSWEGFCSGSGLVKLARLRYPEAFGPESTPRAFVAAALAGDARATAVAREAGEWLGKGLAVLIDVLNPDRIVLGTLGVVLGDLLIEPAWQVIRAEALPVAAAACRIVPAALGPDLQDIASLVAAIQVFRRDPRAL